MLHIAVLFLFLNFLFWSTNAKSGKPCLHKTDAPKLTLPWGTYKAEPYEGNEDVLLFKNIRFAKPPVGDLRFAAPQYPDPISDNTQVQDSSFGPNCIQAKIKQDDVSPEPPANDTQSEDCLFLDIYVPSYALEPDAERLPVVVWIFGGAYIFGGKNTTFTLPEGPYSAYDGKGIREITDEGLIWVTGNYRLGAYGFLAGTYMEENAQTNAGLHDQRLLLDWVQKYIGQIGGDKSSVSVWGLSAGGGSILHHLTAYGGTKKEAPLFDKAVMWSTAFQWAYDRMGSLQETFFNFTSEANCADADNALQCLREADNETLRTANQNIVSQNLALGLFPFGPAVDGDLVPDLPAVLLNEGRHIDVSSFIISHDLDEASKFLAKWVKTEADFTRFLSLAFPGQALEKIRQSIETEYPSVAFNDNQKARMRTVLRDSTFVCNNYQIYMAYKNTSQVYAARYEIPPAQHGSDLLPIIWNNNVDISNLIKLTAPWIPNRLANMLEVIWRPFASRYQLYFGGHALSGDPNHLTGGRGLRWEVTTDDGEEVTNSMKIGLMYINRNHPYYSLGRDNQVSAKNCDFWNSVAGSISKLMGDGTGMEERPHGLKTQLGKEGEL